MRDGAAFLTRLVNNFSSFDGSRTGTDACPVCTSAETAAADDEGDDDEAAADDDDNDDDDDGDDDGTVRVLSIRSYND